MHSVEKIPHAPMPMVFGETPITGTTPKEVVAANLYRTFWFSQGHPELDTALTDLLKYQYARDFTAEEWHQAGWHVGDPEDPTLLQLSMPRGHRNVAGDGVKSSGSDYQKLIADDFSMRWRKFGRFFARNQQAEQDATAEHLEKTLQVVERSMLATDYRYNTHDRNRRFSPDNDPHQSMYQTYVLEGRPTGSPQYDNIFSELRQRFIENGPPTATFVSLEDERKGYADVAAAWQTNHPGDDFEPDDPAIQQGIIKGQLHERLTYYRQIQAGLPLGGLIMAIRDKLQR